MKHLLVECCLAALIVSSTSSVAAASPEDDKVSNPPELAAYRINPHPPTIDGDLSDSIWQSDHIEYSTYFTQQEPDEGLAPTESTMVAVAYDEGAVYVAFWCYDADPGAVSRQLVRRDRSAESDRVSMCIDAFHDHQTCYRFEVSAAGVQTDTRYYNNDNSDRSWDAVWESAVKIQPWGWSAEMRIPYHCLRFAAQETHVWGVNFTRWINRKNEYVKWSYTPSSQGGFVSNFGHLTSLSGIRPARRLEFLPYVSSRVERAPRSVSNPDGKDFRKNAGFDLKYALSSNLILDATINPDFGQVELDEPVLNLSTYETFFPERRPFFLEGADLFQSDFMLFYSRRIGRAPGSDVNDANLLYYTRYPDAMTILGAGKVTGKLSSGTAIAFLSAVTDKETANYGAEINRVEDSTWIGDSLVTDLRSADTAFRRGLLEPRANYSVLRIKQDVFNNSSVGAMVTSASQKGMHSAVTGGVDWRLSTNDNAWGTEGQVVFSQVDPLRTGLGMSLSINKSGGKHTRGAAGVVIKDPHLSINDLGYTSRVNSRRVWGWMQYRTNDDWWIVRNSYNNFNVWSSWNYDDVNYELGGNFNTYIEFTNFWSMGGGVGIQAEQYSDRETRGNGLWQWPNNPTYSTWLSLDTDQRRKISFNINPGAGTDRGGWWWANYVGIRYRPRGNTEFSTGVNFSQHFDATRWVENDGDSSVFAILDQDQISLSASASVLLNRNLSIQLSAEGLVYSLDYEDYRYYQGGNDYSEPLTGFDHDRKSSALNSTLLLRWEYHPGSTVYLVWTRSGSQNYSGNTDLDITRDLQRLFAGSVYNTFLVKASYWMNL